MSAAAALYVTIERLYALRYLTSTCGKPEGYPLLSKDYAYYAATQFLA